MARTILVVDDEPTLRETLADGLEAEGFTVVTAADGREALTQFRASRPDLIVLDLMLPELSGVEVCRIVRAESPVPILMLTAKDSEVDKVVGGVFDVNAVQETIQTCRSARKPYAVVVNGAPAERDGVESRIVTIAREALAKFRAPVWSGQITNRADLIMALSQGEGAREYYAEGRAAAEITRLWGAIERSIKAIRGSASASGAMHKQAA